MPRKAVTCYTTQDGLDKLDEMRGTVSRSKYLELLILHEHARQKNEHATQKRRDLIGAVG